MKSKLFVLFLLGLSGITYSQSSKDFFKSALKKSKAGNYHGAIEDYTAAIELNPQDHGSFGNRGIIKNEIKDFMGAIVDFNIALELRPRYSNYYRGRGTAKAALEDHRGAIADFTKAIEFSPKIPIYYNLRAIEKSSIKDYIGAIVDLTKAIEVGTTPFDSLSFRKAFEAGEEVNLGPIDVSFFYYNRGIVKSIIEDYRGAIIDHSKAIELDPKFSNAYLSRGFSKIHIGQKDNGCLDFSKAGELGNKEAYDAIKEFCN